MTQTVEQSSGGRPEAPEARETRDCVLREGMSQAGRSVRLSRDQGHYQGARPYYTVAYNWRGGKADRFRYTPGLDRAEFLFEQFQRDITDPSAYGAPEGRPRP